MTKNLYHINKTNIKVIGVGGGGCNAVDYMSDESISGVTFYGLNTDLQALNKTNIEHKIQLGEEKTRGLGAGADPEIGRLSAEESIETIKEILQETDMVFITAGMGGGTGTGAAPVVAKVAKEMGILTIGIVTKPFNFENRTKAANKGIEELRKNCDCLLVIPNSNLININARLSLLEMFQTVDSVLLNSVKGISEIITKPSLINVDFADVKRVMSHNGSAMLGMGSASGENKIVEATKIAIQTPLLETKTIRGAKGVLINISGDVNFTMQDLENIGNLIREEVHEDATIITGVSIDTDIDDTVSVTIVATDIDENYKQEKNLIDIMPSIQEKAITIKNHFESNIKKEPSFTEKDILEEPTLNIKTENREEKTKLKEKNSDIFDIPNFLKKQSK